MKHKKDLKEKQSKLEKLGKQISELYNLKNQLDKDIKKQEKIESGKAELEEKINNLHRFGGSLSEYNSLMNQEHIIIDTGKPAKFVVIDPESDREWRLLKILIDEGCTALIRYVPFEGSWESAIGGYGIPVRKNY